MGPGLTIITGTGRSGTSLVAAAFRAATVDPGGAWNDRWRAGFEHGPVVQMNKHIMQAERYPECGASKFTALRFRQQLRAAVSGRRIVKDPRFSFTLDAWVHAGLVDRVIVALRAPSEVQPSADRVGMTVDADPLPRLGYMSWVCDVHEIPRSVIRFPEVARSEGADFLRLINEIARMGVNRAKAAAAIRSVVKRDLVEAH